MSKDMESFVGQRVVLNGTLISIPNSANPNLVLINGTIIQVRLHEPFKDSQLNELLYVIIVIVFYATALMTLIITQIKRQRREGTEVDYYDEYLQRNCEVKRTCQTATNIVKQQGHSNKVTSALASAAVAAASAGSILGTGAMASSTQGGDESQNFLLSEESPGTPPVSSTTLPGMTGLLPGLGPARILPRDRSLSSTCVLESIPDEEL